MNYSFSFFSIIIILSYGVVIQSTTSSLHSYLWANYLHSKQDFSGAHSLYHSCLQEKLPPKAYIGYLQLLFDEHNYKQFIATAQACPESYKNNPDMQYLYVLCCEKLGDISQAHALTFALATLYPTHADIVLKTIQYCLATNKIDHALKTVNAYLSQAPYRQTNFLFYFLKSQIHVMKKEWKLASESIKSSLSLHPQFDKSWLLSAAIEEQLGNIQNAIKGYKNFLQTTATPMQSIEDHLTYLLVRTSSTVRSPISSAFDQAYTLYHAHQFIPALKIIDSYLKTYAHDIHMRLLKIQIICSQGNIAQAYSLLEQWINEEPENDTWYQTAHLIGRSYGYSNARKMFVLLEKKHPSLLLPSLYLADIYLRTNQKRLAYKSLSKLSQLCRKPDLLGPVLFQKALIEYENSNYKALKKTLALVEKNKITYGPLETLLAEYYARCMHDLPQAEHHIQCALQADPENPHILDTQAFIFYKQQRYEKASEILEKLALTNATDFSILKLLGKTLYKQQVYDRAFEVMETAYLQTTDPRERLRARKYLNRWRIGITIH